MFNIPKINSITYKQLLDAAQSRAFSESKGTLNDFSRHNPLYVLVSTLVWSGTEILYYANKFAERLAYTFLSLLADTTGTEGTKAACTLQIDLTVPTVLEVPKGTRVQGSFSNNTVVFETVEALLFDGVETSATVLCEAVGIGSGYNIPTGVLTRFVQPLSFISSVTNVTAAFGADPVSQSEATAIALERIRSRALVSENDFIFYCTQAMGKGSVATVIGNLSADKTRFEIGSIHVFLLDANLFPASQTLINQVSAEIYSTNPPMIGTNLYFSPMEVLEIRIEIVVKIDKTVTNFQIAEAIYKQLENYLAVENHKPGQEFNIRQFESRIWLIPGIIEFQPITVNSDNVNISTSKQVKMVPQYVSATLVNVDNVISEVLIGAGESVYS